MSTQIAFLVIVSALLHAGWNAILKRRAEPENAVAGVLLVSGTSAASLALVYGSGMPTGQGLVWSLLCGVVQTAYFVALAKALARAPLGPVYTIVRGGSLFLVWPASVSLFGEHVTPYIAVGTLFTIVGLAAAGASESRVPMLDALEDAEALRAPPVPMLARATSGSMPPPPPRRPSGAFASPAIRPSRPSFADATDIPSIAPLPPNVKRTFHWAVAAAVFGAIYQIGYKMALTKGGQPDNVVAITMLMPAIAQLTLMRKARPAMRELREAPLAIVGAGLLCTLSCVLFARAVAHGGDGVLNTLRNTSIMFAQGLAFFVGGERPKRLAVVGAMLVTTGAVLLSL